MTDNKPNRQFNNALEADALDYDERNLAMTDKTFWEWFGLKEGEATTGETLWIDQNDNLVSPLESETSLPCLTPDNIFKYCIPELQKRGYVINIQCYRQGINNAYSVAITRRYDTMILKNGEDLAQVLRQAIEGVIK